MASPAVLSVRIIGDASSAKQALGDVETASGRMSSALDTASIGAGIALAGLAGAAVAVGNAASEAQQAAGAVDSVFGSYAENVHNYAAGAADAVGLAKDEYGNLASVIGAQLGNMGVSQDQLAGQTDDLITMGADLAATFGGKTSDAVAALSSLMRGERDPIERYGVSIKAADVEAQKAAMGLAGLTGEADAAATTQATLALLTQQTANAQGQFAREADSASGAQQRANAEWQNAQIALGEQLLPMMTEGARIAGELAKWMGENVDVVTILAVVIGALAAGILIINGAMKAYAAIQAIQTAAQWANNTAWLSSPVTWIILAVIAAIAILIAIIVLVIENWDEIARVAAEVWGAVIGWLEAVGKWIYDAIVGQFNAVMGFFTGLRDTAVDAFETVISWVQSVLDWIGQLTSGLMPSWLKDMLGMKTASMSISTDFADPPNDPFAPFGGPPRAGMMLSRSAPAAPAKSLAQTVSMLGASGPGSATPQIINRYDIRIEGAIDVDGTGRTLEGIMRKHGARVGTRSAGGGA